MGYRTLLNLNRTKLAKNAGAVLYLDARKSTGNGLPSNSPLTSPWVDLSGTTTQFNNLITNPEMNTDSNIDGVVDGFAKLAESGITASYQLDSSSQKITISNSTIAGNDAYVYQDISISAGDILSISVNAYKIGTISIRAEIDWYNGATKINSVVSTSNATSFTNIKLENKTAPANTTTARVRFGVYTNVIGDTGSGWFKSSIAIKRPDARVGLIGNDAFPINFAGTTASGVDVSDPLRPCWVLDGTDDFFSLVNTPSIDVTSAPLAVFATIKCLGTASGFIISKNLDAVGNIQYAIYWGSGAKGISAYMNGGQRGASLNDSVPTNIWYNVGFIWDGTNIKYYINLAQNGDAYAYNTTLTSRANIQIGKIAGASPFMFKGNIATLSIYAGANCTEANVLKSEGFISKPYIAA